MSGKKKSLISLSPQENESLHQNIMRRLFLIKPDPEVEKESNASYKNMVAEIKEQNIAREKSFLKETSRFSQQLAEIEQQTSQRIMESQDQVDILLAENIQKQQSNLVDILDTTLQTYNQNILQTHHVQQQQISRLRRQLTNQNEILLDKIEIVENWLKNTETLLNFIDTQYQHPKFAPGRLDPFFEDLQLAFQNFDQQLYEAALVTAQNVYRRGSDLRIILERDENQWRTFFVLVQCRLDGFIKKMENEKIIEFKPAESVPSVEFDVDFWSKGEWTALCQTANRFKLQLQTNSNQLTIQDLRQWVIQDIPAMEGELEKIKTTAVDNLVDSQIRTNIADLIMQALGKQGYQLAQAQFLAEDSRQGFEFTAKSISGNAIRVFVNPGPDDENEIQLEAIDQRPQTEHFLNRRAAEISQALQKMGLKIDHFIQQPDSIYAGSMPQSLSLAEKKGHYAVH